VEILNFAARHRIGAMAEVMPRAEANAALDKARAGKARYRMVLKTRSHQAHTVTGCGSNRFSSRRCAPALG
jgi:uncharacterized protein (DUF885 family)